MVALFANNAHGTLNAGIGAGDLSITLDSGQGNLFPNPTGGDFFRAELERVDLTAFESVWCTARAGDVLTVLRGQDGSTATTFVAGSRLRLRPVAVMLEEIAGLLEIEESAVMTGFVGVGQGTAPSVWGGPSANTGGTVTYAGVASTSRQTSVPGMLFTATGAAQALGRGVWYNQGRVWRGNAANRGGWDSWQRWAIGADLASVHAFIGMDDNTSATYAGGNPSSRTTVAQIGIGYDNTGGPGTNWFLFHHDGGGGAVTVVDTGFARNTTDDYAVHWYAPANGSYVDVTMYNLRTDEIFEHTITTNLPPSGAFLVHRFHAQGAIGMILKIIAAWRFNVNQSEPIV